MGYLPKFKVGHCDCGAVGNGRKVGKVFFCFLCYNELDRWFKGRRNEMKGVCANCLGKSCRDDDKYYKFSIAHLLPKAYFKSVATHPDNWIELCHFQNSCHTNFDNHMIDLIELNCFDSVIEKFVKIYPDIAQDERRRIPAILLDYIEIEK